MGASRDFFQFHPTQTNLSFKTSYLSAFPAQKAQIGDATADAVTYAHKSVIAAVYTHAKRNSTSIAWINTPTQKRHTRDN